MLCASPAAFWNEDGSVVDNSGSITTPTVPVPKVLSSKIYANNDKRILVEWDTEMKGSADIRFAISIIVDGAQPIVPNAVTFNKKFMTLSDNFVKGQVITWAYDDQNATELLSTVVGDIEADNQTYAVENDLADEPDDGVLDLDGDGNPDDVIYDANGILITEDIDSIDIDIDGDGIADIHIPK